MNSGPLVKGVSVVICCYNGAERLPETLAHLAAQKTSPETLWEVIVIDNASTDATAEIAKSVWPLNAPTPLRVIHEPRPGTSFARTRGLSESSYEFVCFVDDDNRVCDEWVEVVAEVMTHNPQVGACGGFIASACEAAPPSWFKQYESGYAPGAQGQAEGGDVTWRGFLMGAGLTIRRAAWQQMMNNGFQFLLVGRQGTNVTAGEDHELCKAMALAGWRLWYEPRLQLKHVLPASRLNWSLFRRQTRGAGRCEPVLDLYDFVLREDQGDHGSSWLNDVRQSWLWQMAILMRHLCRPYKFGRAHFRPYEGDLRIAWFERQLGRFQGLIDIYGSHKPRLQTIREAKWRKITPTPGDSFPIDRGAPRRYRSTSITSKTS